MEESKYRSAARSKQFTGNWQIKWSNCFHRCLWVPGREGVQQWRHPEWTNQTPPCWLSSQSEATLPAEQPIRGRPYGGEPEVQAGWRYVLRDLAGPRGSQRFDLTEHAETLCSGYWILCDILHYSFRGIHYYRTELRGTERSPALHVAKHIRQSKFAFSARIINHKRQLFSWWCFYTTMIFYPWNSLHNHAVLSQAFYRM